MDMMELHPLIRKYALQNAVFFGGKAEVRSVMGKVMADRPELRSKAREVMEEVEEVVREINVLSLSDQVEALEKTAPELLKREKERHKVELPPLPNVGEDVVMRLAPYPSGPLHIGHSRMAILNDEYVKRYSGKLILVFDDTIGSEEKIPVPGAYDMIRDGLEWLGIEYHETIYKSDRMGLFYDWGERLLKGGHAYVCECPADVLRLNRERGIECSHRKKTIDQNLEAWFRMLDGYYREGEAVVRLKTDMSHPNPAFRDRVLFRISERKHPRVGRKYSVWPMLEFSWAVDDHLLGVTHILRGKDLIMEDEMESYIWNTMGIEGAEFVHYGMLRLKEMKLSKSRLQRDIDKGTFIGIEDPRTWTLQSLRKRGIEPQALREFILGFGVSLTDVEVAADNLYAINRKMIDRGAKRYFFVPDPVKIRRVGTPEDLKVVRAPFHPDFREGKMRIIDVSSDVTYVSSKDFRDFRGKEIRLKDFCNVILEREAKVTSTELKDVPKIQWVVDYIPVEVVMPDGHVEKGYGEASLRDVREGEVIQFERFGFVRIEKKDSEIRAFYAHR